MLNTLEFVLLLLAAAVVLVGMFRSMNLPPVLGYLLVGALGGPHALNLMQSSEDASHLAEFGVVFLMFSIGLEFSLGRLILKTSITPPRLHDLVAARGGAVARWSRGCA